MTTAMSTRSAALYVARQPIFDRRLEVYAYELLARRAAGDEQALIDDGDAETARTLVHAFHEIGLDHLVGDRLAFVNVTRPYLIGQVELPFAPQRVVLELPAAVVVDTELVEGIGDLVRAGWRISVDAAVDRPDLWPLLDLAAFAKLDVGAGLGHDELAEQVAGLGRHDLDVIALRVETHDQLRQVQDLGVDYVQGFVLSRPDIVAGRPVPTDRGVCLRLLADVHRPDANLEDLELIIRRDLSLAWRVLRSVNAAAPSLVRRIDSVRDAVVLLGERRVRQWLTLTVLAGIDGKPVELLTTALIRAAMCEQLAPLAGASPEAAFMVGLLSVLDALLDAELDEVLAELPLTEQALAALERGEGPAGRVLGLAVAWERGDLEVLTGPAGRGLPLLECYLRALAWAQGLTDELARDPVPRP
jgi:EAL and modified HD-GYP domain-containing signal transduction protein